MPLVVVKELDDKNNTARGKLSKRANRSLKELRACLADGRGPEQVGNRSGVTVEVSLGFDDLDRSNADQAIIDVARGLSFRPGNDVVIVTGDYSMQLRAAAVGLRSFALDDELRLPAENGG